MNGSSGVVPLLTTTNQVEVKMNKILDLLPILKESIAGRKKMPNHEEHWAERLSEININMIYFHKLP